MTNVTLASYVRNARKHASLTKNALAVRAGVNAGQISLVESGGSCSAHIMARICAVLPELDSSRLLALNEDRRRSLPSSVRKLRNRRTMQANGGLPVDADIVRKRRRAELTNEGKSDLHQFGWYIRDLRVSAGITQKQLADKLKISCETVGQIERGSLSGLAHSAPLAKHIPGVSLDELTRLGALHNAYKAKTRGRPGPRATRADKATRDALVAEGKGDLHALGWYVYKHRVNAGLTEMGLGVSASVVGRIEQGKTWGRSVYAALVEHIPGVTLDELTRLGNLRRAYVIRQHKLRRYGPTMVAEHLRSLSAYLRGVTSKEDGNPYNPDSVLGKCWAVGREDVAG